MSIIALDPNLRLDAILDGGELEATFEKYLVKQMCVENLYFLRKTEEYKKMEDQNKRIVLAQSIWTEFIGDEAAKQINIPTSSRRGYFSFLSKIE